MRITGLIWLKEIVDKLDWKHGILPDEVEAVFLGKPAYRRLEKGKIQGEDVYGAYGRTEAGRYVTVIFILKAGGKALVITARDMDRKERKQYDRRK